MAVNIDNRIVPYKPRNGRYYNEGSTSINSSDSPGTSNGGDKNFIYVQGIPSTTWNIQHNLGKYPSVTVIDTAGTEVEGQITHIDINNCTLEFSAMFAGSATLN